MTGIATMPIWNCVKYKFMDVKWGHTEMETVIKPVLLIVRVAFVTLHMVTVYTVVPTHIRYMENRSVDLVRTIVLVRVTLMEIVTPAKMAFTDTNVDPVAQKPAQIMYVRRIMDIV
ncbi:uncharacterized protein [Argopecten irradians]|uniref:uncharacterized protein n=1 Tax=Argopecten irradians TaxID=31199 RepID=UPI0037165F04